MGSGVANPFKEISPTFTKSPLGIIALFIVLVYAIAGLTASFGQFSTDQLWLVLAFMVLFPCLVLWVFYKLVTEHSKKIYGPGDFASDDAFIDYFLQYSGVQRETVSASGKNLHEWVEADVANRQKLRVWLRDNGISHSVTSFLRTSQPTLHDAAHRTLVK